MTTKALLFALLCGCSSPGIAYYRVTPRKYCPATTELTIEWFTSAKHASLSATPAMPGLGKKAGRGSLKVKPQAAKIQLDYGTDSRPDLELVPITPETSETKGAPAAICKGGVAIAEITFEPQEYAPEVVVTSLGNRLADRDVIVSHLGRQFVVPAGGELAVTAEGTDDLTVRTAHGWLVRVPLKDGEDCSSPSVRNPGVTMKLGCAQ